MHTYSNTKSFIKRTFYDKILTVWRLHIMNKFVQGLKDLVSTEEEIEEEEVEEVAAT